MQKPNDVRLNRYFKLKEFHSPDTETVKITQHLVDGLYMLRMLLKCPIIVTSGFRTREHNYIVGGAKNSLHMEGKAADIVTHYPEMDHITEYCRIIGFTEIRYYPDTNHWHLGINKEK